VLQVPTPATYCTVPQLKGLTLTKAKAAVVRAGCLLGRVTKANAPAAKRGKVLSQAVPAKIQVRTGTKVAIKLGK
jgi:beta-lactam-binding protein with PASTA domain